MVDMQDLESEKKLFLFSMKGNIFVEGSLLLINGFSVQLTVFNILFRYITRLTHVTMVETLELIFLE